MLPCDMLSLATFMPARQRVWSTSGLSEAGPMVATILVLRTAAMAGGMVPDPASRVAASDRRDLCITARQRPLGRSNQLDVDRRIGHHQDPLGVVVGVRRKHEGRLGREKNRTPTFDQPAVKIMDNELASHSRDAIAA